MRHELAREDYGLDGRGYHRSFVQQLYDNTRLMMSQAGLKPILRPSHKDPKGYSEAKSFGTLSEVYLREDADTKRLIIDGDLNFSPDAAMSWKNGELGQLSVGPEPLGHLPDGRIVGPYIGHVMVSGTELGNFADLKPTPMQAAYQALSAAMATIKGMFSTSSTDADSVDKGKLESCVRQLKGQYGKDRAFAICNATLQGKTVEEAIKMTANMDTGGAQMDATKVLTAVAEQLTTLLAEIQGYIEAPAEEPAPPAAADSTADQATTTTTTTTKKVEDTATPVPDQPPPTEPPPVIKPDPAVVAMQKQIIDLKADALGIPRDKRESFTKAAMAMGIDEATKLLDGMFDKPPLGERLDATGAMDREAKKAYDIAVSTGMSARTAADIFGLNKKKED